LSVRAHKREKPVTEPLDIDRHAFLFDVDGTLLDIAPTPQAVQVPQTLNRNLRRLADLAGGALALVSGRPIEDLDRLFDPLRLSAVGGHGAELRLPHGEHGKRELAEPLDAGLRAHLQAIAAIDPHILTEDKGYSFAIHFRLAPDREQAIADAVRRIMQDVQDPIEILHGKAVIEVKRTGFDKGSGVRRLMRCAPFAGRRPVFIGDDVTDEHAFAVMPEFDGIAIAVGRLVPGVSRRFETPADVRRWIAMLCRQHADARD
jgi:trehalose 6-phosphate phosphatase